LNGHYLRMADDARLVEAIASRLENALGRPVDEAGAERLRRGMSGLKARAKNLNELAENALFYVATRPLSLSPKAVKMLADDGRQRLAAILPHLEAVTGWTEASLEASVRQAADQQNLKLGQIAQPLRAALTGSNSSPGLFEVMEILGRTECLARISDQIAER
jgi:glutamyl-tRNA synthetase